MNLFGKLQNEKIVFGLLLVIFLLIVIIGAISNSVPDQYAPAPALNRNVSVKCLQYVSPDGKKPLDAVISELAKQCRDSYAAQGLNLSNYYDTEIYKHEPDAKQGLRIMLNFKLEK